MPRSPVLASLLDNPGLLPIDTLYELFDSLPAVECQDMLGDWRGGCFNTGHRGEAMLEKLGWAGKRFTAVNDVNPIMSADADDQLVVNDVMGTASLRRVEYRGVVTATMVYDQHPIFDHFRRVSDTELLGVMDSKGDEMPLYFYLMRAG